MVGSTSAVAVLGVVLGDTRTAFGVAGVFNTALSNDRGTGVVCADATSATASDKAAAARMDSFLIWSLFSVG